MGRITAEIAPGADQPTLDSIKQRNTRARHHDAEQLEEEEEEEEEEKEKEGGVHYER